MPEIAHNPTYFLQKLKYILFETHSKQRFDSREIHILLKGEGIIYHVAVKKDGLWEINFTGVHTFS